MNDHISTGTNAFTECSRCRLRAVVRVEHHVNMKIITTVTTSVSYAGAGLLAEMIF